jgi:hypothetical protein
MGEPFCINNKICGFDHFCAPNLPNFFGYSRYYAAAPFLPTARSAVGLVITFSLFHSINLCTVVKSFSKIPAIIISIDFLILFLVHISWYSRQVSVLWKKDCSPVFPEKTKKIQKKKIVGLKQWSFAKFTIRVHSDSPSLN